jgi:AbrB family looped-hinge helix DNA binding protein
MVTKMREKGQITIPSSIRELFHLSKNSILSVTKIGDGIFLTPKPSVFETTSAGFIKEAKQKGITLEDLLEDLRKIRHQDS